MTEAHNRAVRKWYAKNKDYFKKYYNDNKERINANNKVWRKANPDKVKLYNNNRKKD